MLSATRARCAIGEIRLEPGSRTEHTQRLKPAFRRSSPQLHACFPTNHADFF